MYGYQVYRRCAARIMPSEGLFSGDGTIERKLFEALVDRALADLPKEFAEILGDGNVVRVIKDYPSDEQLRSVGLEHPLELLGLYDGIPLTERSVFHTGVQPDHIFIFQRPIEAMCESDEEIAREVRHTVIHEVGHFFGINDERLDELMGKEAE